MPSFRRRAARATRFAALVGLAATAASAPAPVPTLFVAGDSTASFYEPNPKNQQGWGAVLQPFFDESKLRVIDAARGGRSSRTFVSEGHWDALLAGVKRGDFVILQFGHNDSGAVNAEPPGSTRPLRARGTIPGIGAESEEIDNVVTGRHETVYTFGWYLRKMIADTRAKGATPILASITATNYWNAGRMQCTAKDYRNWTWQTAHDAQVPFIDVTRRVADRFQRIGPEATAALFIDDKVHSNLDGAQANARDVVAALRAERSLPLRKFLSRAGRAVRADRGPPRSSVCPPPG